MSKIFFFSFAVLSTALNDSNIFFVLAVCCLHLGSHLRACVGFVVMMLDYVMVLFVCLIAEEINCTVCLSVCLSVRAFCSDLLYLFFFSKS